MTRPTVIATLVCRGRIHLPLLALLALLVPVSPTKGQTPIRTECAKIYGGPGSGDFGCAVAIDGDTLVVGDRANSAGVGLAAAGVAYIFHRDGNAWTSQAFLHDPVPAEGAQFGYSAAVSGDVAIIGSPARGGDDLGAAFVYRRTGTTWAQEALLTGSDPHSGDLFGIDVAIAGDTAIVYSPFGYGPAGSGGLAYVFERIAGSWIEKARLAASAGGDRFGGSPATDGYTLVVAASGTDEACPGNPDCNSGSAYVFARNDAGTPADRSDDTWVQRAHLTPSDGVANDGFGIHVAQQGDTVLVGSIGFNVTLPRPGFLYIYQDTSPGGDWSAFTETKILASDTTAADQFGTAVAIAGDMVVAGANDADPCGIENGGSAYVLRRTASGWTEERKLLSSDDSAGDFFGQPVAISGTTVVCAARGEDDPGGGSVYIFDLSPSAPPPTGTGPCPDTDGDGLLDTNEATLAQGTGCPNPLDPDSDDDGLNDGAEVAAGTNPCNPDTDGDGLFDGTEVGTAQAGCPNPLNPDSDEDGLSDGAEVAGGTNPCAADTDGDGVPDASDPLPLQPGVTCGLLEEMMRTVATDIDALDLDLFNGANANANVGRRNSLATRVQSAANRLCDGQHASALAHLNAVLEKIDDVEPTPDWMFPSAEKTSLRESVLLLLSLTLLLG
jgi:FG-GAP repeat protein/thrombospondin type 3 repeat protein